MPDPADHYEILAAKAEEVRAYLVAMRGGAPFLSAPDSRLLLKWLEAGVPVVAITAAIDKVAEKRRRKRVKSRLSLSAARGEVKLVAEAPLAQAQEIAEEEGGFQAWIDALAALEVGRRFEAPREALVAEVSTIASNDPAEMAEAAIAAVRRFHEAAWEALDGDKDPLLAKAEAELESLRGVMDEARFAAAAEEVARDLLRCRFPLISARAVWDSVCE